MSYAATFTTRSGVSSCVPASDQDVVTHEVDCICGTEGCRGSRMVTCVYGKALQGSGMNSGTAMFLEQEEGMGIQGVYTLTVNDFVRRVAGKVLAAQNKKEQAEKEGKQITLSCLWETLKRESVWQSGTESKDTQ